jgi:uncharacterized NAD(P)/FAD-binding protein YdhS
MYDIIIVGGGFCGTALAIQLMRQAKNRALSILIVDRQGTLGRGVAYGTCDDDHLLNVPAGNMSALDDQPDDFLQYCQQLDPSATSSSFVPRRIYGDYLEQLLAETERQFTTHVTLHRVQGDVHDLRSDEDGRLSVMLHDGRHLTALRVVLATGNERPMTPQGLTARLTDNPRYISDPWQKGALEALDRNSPTLLIGTGLTALDICATLSRRTGSAPIYILSRRGLVPQAHRPTRTPGKLDYQKLLCEEVFRAHGYGLRALARYVRTLAKEEDDWREVVGALRPHTQHLWTKLSLSDQQRFLRHLRTHWDTHRHRVAPTTYERFQHQVITGAVKLIAGRISNCTESDQGFTIQVSPRGSGQLETISAGHIVNCTGPNVNPKRTSDRLHRQLLDSQMLQADVLGLGLELDEYGGAKGWCDDKPSRLYYLGPMLRGRYWEATAVPELRLFVRRLATKLLNDL